jgi:hypothetical protein
MPAGPSEVDLITMNGLASSALRAITMQRDAVEMADDHPEETLSLSLALLLAVSKNSSIRRGEGRA